MLVVGVLLVFCGSVSQVSCDALGRLPSLGDGGDHVQQQGPDGEVSPHALPSPAAAGFSNGGVCMYCLLRGRGGAHV